MSGGHSVSDLLAGLEQGDSESVQALWQHYFERMVRLARRKLEGDPRRVADEEDVALSAFRRFCAGARAGRYPDLKNRAELWRLLFKVTADRATDLRRANQTQGRGGGKVRGESAFENPTPGQPTPAGLTQFIGQQPTPEAVVSMAEQCRKRLAALDHQLQRIVLAKLEGRTNPEVAERCGCSLRTVERRLELVRLKWSRETETE